MNISAEELHRLRRVAGGDEQADLIVRGGTVLALHTDELLERDIVIAGRHIAAITPVGRFEAGAEIDARGLHVAPTFVDTHIHLEYTMLTPGELARLVVPKGTVTVLADPNCIANVLGAAGMDIVGSTGTPLRIFQQVSPNVPIAPSLQLGGAVVEEDEIIERLSRSNAVTLGESNPYTADLASSRRYAAALAAGRRITGHTARLSDEPLWSYLAGGVGDDHNAVTTAEVLERLRLGAVLTVMAGSMNDNCPTVFADLEALRPAFGRITFCADDKHVADLVEQGHIDHHVRQAIAAGVDVLSAYRMASLNAAVHYRLDHLLGSLAPSRLADLQLIGDLRQARPDLVLVGGQTVAEKGRALFTNPDTVPEVTRDTIRLHPGMGPATFRVPASGDRATVRAMEMYDGYFKHAFEAELPVVDGSVVADPARDIAKVAVVDRHHATGAVGLGFVRGFGLSRGALATSTNCDNQNLVVVGASDQEMAVAARAVRDLGGGYAVVDGDTVTAAVPLPVAGIMSDRPWEEVHAALVAANEAAAGLGCRLHSPFMIMAFIGLPGVPDLGLTERGLIDTASQSFTPTVVEST